MESTNNKLIAEFMGLSIKEGVSYYTDQDDMFFMGVEVEEPYLPFDEDWNWLMPVANEIIKSRDEQNADWDLTQLKYALCTTNIDYVYNAVVEFIKQYNDGK